MSCTSCKSEAHFPQPQIAHRKFSSPEAHSTKIFLACGTPIKNCLRLRRAYRKLSSSAVRSLKSFVACGATIDNLSSPAARPSKMFVAYGATIENLISSPAAQRPARSSKTVVACGAPMENCLCLRRAHRKLSSPAVALIENFLRLRALIENSPRLRRSNHVQRNEPIARSMLRLYRGSPARRKENVQK